MVIYRCANMPHTEAVKLLSQSLSPCIHSLTTGGLHERHGIWYATVSYPDLLCKGLGCFKVVRGFYQSLLVIFREIPYTTPRCLTDTTQLAESETGTSHLSLTLHRQASHGNMKMHQILLCSHEYPCTGKRFCVSAWKFYKHINNSNQFT
jgi:hypothetical protein